MGGPPSSSNQESGNVEMCAASLLGFSCWAEALPKNPEAVLFLEYSGTSLKHICSLPFLMKKQEWINDYVAKTLPILENLATLEETLHAEPAKICTIRMKAAHQITKNIYQKIKGKQN